MDKSFALRYATDGGSTQHAPTLNHIALFPWTSSSLRSVWAGTFCPPNGEIDQEWRDMCRDYGGYMAVGGDDGLRVYDVSQPGRWSLMHHINFSGELVRCLTWAISRKRPYDPLLVIATSAVLHVFDLRLKIVTGRMRGHGGAITSLSTNPIWPYLVLSTSRDHTSRVWDLSERPTYEPCNPIWPGLPPPTLAGAPHGLQASEPEGDGDGAGACVALLMGGRAGGHEATVTAAAWHPKGLPVVATCSVDRCVKIWRIPNLEPDATILVNTDKPIFSSSHLHQGRVLSVTWLADDLLVTHSAPIRTVVDGTDYDEEEGCWQWEVSSGTLCIWRWLGFGRFFPNGDVPEGNGSYRSSQADYQESTSFRIISELSLPKGASDMQVYTLPGAEAFILLETLEGRQAFWHIPLVQLPVYQTQPYPGEHTRHNRFGTNMVHSDLVGDEEKVYKRNMAHLPQLTPTGELKIQLARGNLKAWAVARGGRVVFAVGERASMWMWSR